METVYKLTDKNMRTFNGCQWKLGEEKTTSGEGEMCGPGWLHAHTDPLLAVLLNPIHARIQSPRLFRAETPTIGKEDYGLKVGVISLTLIEELPLPVISTAQRVRFAIYCAMEVHRDPTFLEWANKWLSGEDRGARAAAEARAALAAEVALAAAEWAVLAAAEARAAAEAEWAAAEAARAAAEAAAHSLDLINLAQRAIREEK